MPQWIWNSPKFKDWYIIELIRINRALHTYDIATLLIAFNETKVLSVKNPKFIVKCEEVALRPKKELTPSTVEVYKPRILPEQKDRMEGL